MKSSANLQLLHAASELNTPVTWARAWMSPSPLLRIKNRLSPGCTRPCGSLRPAAPRVRFGQVHLYNNLYKIVNTPSYVYSWGVGAESQIYAVNNAFITDQSIAPALFIKDYSGTDATKPHEIYAAGTMVNGTPGGKDVDLVAAYNAAYNPDLGSTVSWTPALFVEYDPTWRVIPAVQSGAGPFNW